MMQLQRLAVGQVRTSLLLLLLLLLYLTTPFLMPVSADAHWHFAEANHQQPSQQDHMQATMCQAEAEQGIAAAQPLLHAMHANLDCMLAWH